MNGLNASFLPESVAIIGTSNTSGEPGVKSGKGFYTYPNPEFLQLDFLNPKNKTSRGESI